MWPRRVSFQPGVGRSIPSDLLRAVPGHLQLGELAGAYVNGNGRCLNVSREPAVGWWSLSCEQSSSRSRFLSLRLHQTEKLVSCAYGQRCLTLSVGTGHIGPVWS